MEATSVTSSTLRGGAGNDTIAFADERSTTLSLLLALELTPCPSMVLPDPALLQVRVMTPSTSLAMVQLALPPTTSVRLTVRTRLSFGALTGSQNLVIAVDAAYGATSGIQFSGDLDAGTGNSGTITFNNAESGVATGTLFLNNVTGSSEGCWRWRYLHLLRDRLHGYDH